MTVEAILALEDGSIFTGTSIGVNGHAIGEVVFNTSMTGYQEILTDPSYCQQIVTLTYPHIGNTGTNIEDMESRKTQASGLIIRNSSLVESSWRSTQSLNGFLESSNTVAIADIDTRKLTQLLREKGAQSGCIMAGEIDENIAIKIAKGFPGLLGMDLAKSLIRPTKLYSDIFAGLSNKLEIHGAAHITGGGITENLPRSLTNNVKAEIDLNKWNVPKIFKWIQSYGITPSEMLKTFNCGYGMVVILEKSKLNK